MYGERMSDRKNGFMKSIARNKKYRRAFFAVAAAAALLFGMGFFGIRTQAGTTAKKTATRIIRTKDEADFAAEASRLAKKNRGVIAYGTGDVRPYSSARLIVRVKDKKKVDFSKYRASTVVESSFGVNLVQFATEKQARKAAASLSALSSVAYVEPDDNAVDTGDAVIRGSAAKDESGSDSPGEYGVDTIPGGSAADDGSDLTYSSTIRKDQPPSLGTDTVSDKNTGSSGTLGWGTSYIQADQYAAYVKTCTKKSITVAVVDSGVADHPKLNGRILKGKDLVDNDNDPTDRFGHGTHVAGIIVDCTPGLKVNILPVRALDSSGRGNVSTIGNAIRYAVRKGAKVINLSLGTYSHYRYLEECIAYADQRGVTVVAAAGNENENVRYVCPAHLSTPIVVGAINKNGMRAFFSNYGSSLDVVAPGVAVRSCWLGGGYATADGTSMAAPYISAAAAMYQLIYPSYKPSDIEKMIKSYSKDLGTKGRDNMYGYGVPKMTAAIAPKKVSLNINKKSIAVNTSATLKAKIVPSNAGRSKLNWSSSNKKVVSVSGGKLTAKKAGKATITVKTVNGKKATCRVTVTDGSKTNVASTKNASKNVSSKQKQTKTENTVEEDLDSASSNVIEEDEQKKNNPAVKTTWAFSAQAVSVQSFSARAFSVQALSGEGQTAQSISGQAAQALPGQEEKPDGLKAHIFPSSREGNAQLHDGSLYTGERLALDVEIVPAREIMPALKWRSSDPKVAEVDENGVVTTRAKGTARIEVSLRGDSSGSEDSQPAIGSYFIKVEEPSILTRRASYSAEQEDLELEIRAVVRAPGLPDRETELKADETSSGPLVLGFLKEDQDGDSLLLGAVDLNGKDAGNVHIHNGNKGKRLKGNDGYSEDDLLDGPSSLISVKEGKRPQDKGLLRLEEIEGGKGKADLVIYTALVPDEKGKAGKKPGTSQKEGEVSVSKCHLAVYTAGEFEERESAALEGDEDLVREIDSNALCKCSFEIRQTIILPKEADGTDPDQKITGGTETDQVKTDKKKTDQAETGGKETDQRDLDCKESDSEGSGTEIKDQETEDTDNKDPKNKDPETEDSEKEDQKKKDQETEDQDIKDQDTKGQEKKAPETEDQNTEGREKKDPETEDQDTEGQEKKDPETKDSETKDPETEGQGKKDQETGEQETKDQETKDQDLTEKKTEDPEKNKGEGLKENRKEAELPEKEATKTPEESSDKEEISAADNDETKSSGEKAAADGDE